MAIYPPTKRNWWNQPIARVELIRIAIAFVWALIMFAMMPYWRLAGSQNVSNEAYRVNPDDFADHANDDFDERDGYGDADRYERRQ